ncbi:MAG: hypothetical protein COW01_09560 [Bdellovibrionales bacterium CG12_big_fil_rev_8_21_14_0_65_38_15]|nr:MAG: hypothetical protein COW79_09565 [Bdellovibrionales bacterium CG22_combo_CG10-13_8_21_14_all_38_13]PIQ54774.1 MAG: hypothetical protein COW01_09560 [Bdellovibrionales bacterium CG12_big_fil_rev_8_21_14_0_65_38_15]PIR31329.1 MAG: hypothetical protein COV38_01175 [Bdellovibrionales bacterium CG11_big_fil_rev_8_21_14_0_20_38_13]
MKIIFLLLFSISSSLFASRGPAVEPVTGISIEEYNETTPQPGRGFDFNQTDTFFEKAPTDTSLTMTTVAFLIFASSLPFIVWFGVMRALPDATPVNSEAPTARPSLTVVAKEPSSSNDEDDDQHWPKAS